MVAKSSSATKPETTGEHRAKAAQGKPPVEHQFKPGNPGRPKGSRNKLGEAFITALHDDFQEHGVAVIAKVRDERPHEYLKVVASLLPKQVEIKETAFDGIPDEQLAAIVAAARDALGVRDGGGEGAVH
jgi:hypothetical protein